MAANILFKAIKTLRLVTVLFVCIPVLFIYLFLRKPLWNILHQIKTVCSATLI